MRMEPLHAAAPRLIGLVYLLLGHHAATDERRLLLELPALPRDGASAWPHDHLAAVAEIEPLLEEDEAARQLHDPRLLPVDDNPEFVA